MENTQPREWPIGKYSDAVGRDQFNMLRIGMLLCQDNRDLDPNSFEELTGVESIADYINTKYDMNVRKGYPTYRLLIELDEKIRARAMPSLPTE